MPDPPGVSIAFTGNWNVGAPTWTRIDTLSGCRVRSWSVDRGRPNEFAKTGTGTATVSIVDRDGIFDPLNGTGPYAGAIRAGRQAAISLRNPINDTWHIRFRGYVEAWRYRLSQTRDYMELELNLVDGFAMLARAELQVGVHGALPPFTGYGFTADQIDGLNKLAAGNVLYPETAGPVKDRILAILTDVGWPTALAVDEADIFSGNVRVGPKAYGPGTSALDALWDAADGEFVGVANLFMAADGHLRFRGRQARFRPLVAEYGIQRRTVGDPSETSVNADAVPISELEWAVEDTEIVNACTATPQGVGTGDSWRPLDPDLDDVPGQLVTDTTSRNLHGLQSLTFDNLQTIEGIATSNDSLQETKLMATYYVENFKAGDTPRISRMVFKSRVPGTLNVAPLWLHMCNVEISDLLTVKTAHPGGGGFFHDYYVEGIHMTCRPGSPTVPVVELSLDVSPRAHYLDNPFDADPDP